MADIYKVPGPPTPTKIALQSPRGTKLATRVWAPTTKPSCLVLLVHGGGWHSGYWEAIAKYLTSHNNAMVCAYDVVSCGYSEREPGSPDNCTFIREFDDLVEDVFAAIDWAKEEQRARFNKEDLPLFLLGESFGAPQVIKAGFYAPKEGVKIAGVISLGGLVRVGDQLLPPTFVIKIVIWLARYYPKLAMSGVDTESTFDDAFGDKKWARTARADPAIIIDNAPTLSGVAAIMTAGDYILENASKFPWPFLAIHGKYDVRAKFEAVQEFADKVGPKAELIELTNTKGHQLLQDVPEVTNGVMKDVSDWINKTLR